MESKKVNIPKKGAARKWAQRLKNLGKQKPLKDLVDAINRWDRKEKDIAAASVPPERDIEI